MKTLKYSSIFSALITLCISSASFAAQPLLTYSYGNQVMSSTLSVSSSGTVIRMERKHGSFETINENALSGAELTQLKSLLSKALKGKIKSTSVIASLGSQSGTIATYKGAQKINLEGIVRNPTDLTRATKLTNNSPAIKALKSFVNKYVNVKMQ